MTKGIERFKQAIKDQQNLAGCYLGHHDAEEIAAEIEDELAHVSWAEGVPAPVDADGEVVPLTTKVMYTNMGKKIEMSEFDLLHSVLSGGFVWRAIRNTGHVVEDLRLSCLHLRRPDSWKLLEMDVRNFDNNGSCGYYGMETKTCTEGCPAAEDSQTPCSTIALEDVLRRAKALAGAGDAE